MDLRQSESSTIKQVKSKVKVVFLGDQATGKTSILLRFMNGKFSDEQAPTVGIDFMGKNIDIGNSSLRFQLWDTAGQQRFRSLIPSYLKDASVNLIVYDITNRQSFESIREWVQLCQQNKKQKSITILIGNKSDLAEKRAVSKQQAEKAARIQGFPYYEVSAKQDRNIQEVFEEAGRLYLDEHFKDDATIGNIQKFHEGYVNKRKEGEKAENHNGQQNQIQLKNPVGGINQQVNEKGHDKRKKGCC